MANNKKISIDDWKKFIESENISLFQIMKFDRLRNKKGIIHDVAFIWKMIAHSKTYKRYIELLRKPCCYSAAVTDSSILYKIFRPYEVGNLESSERLNILEEHYSILSDYFTVDEFNQLGSTLGLKIIDFVKTDSFPDDVFLSFQYNGTHRREAELTVSILKKCRAPAFKPENVPENTPEDAIVGIERIFSIAINFGYFNNQKVIKINSIQGCTPHLKEPQKEITSITKQAFGILPKYLMLEVTFKIAEIMGINHVLGIKKASHIYNNSHYKSRVSSDDFRYDYDKQWSEFNAKDFNENYYELSPIERTPIEEVPSKKRSQHRKRYAFIDEIKNNLEQIFVKQQ